MLKFELNYTGNHDTYRAKGKQHWLAGRRIHHFVDASGFQFSFCVILTASHFVNVSNWLSRGAGDVFVNPDSLTLYRRLSDGSLQEIGYCLNVAVAMMRYPELSEYRAASVTDWRYVAARREVRETIQLVI
jgi:hypothetical protein